MANILAVDDNIELCKLIRTALERDGHRVETRLSGAELTEQLCRWADCILLDVMMPGEDGFAVCRRIRGLTNAPILFLTARTDEASVLEGLGIGADDYLAKPFRVAELRARVAAHLRRQSRTPVHRLVRGGVSFDLSAREAAVGETPLPLTRSEYAICEHLVLHAGQTFTKEQIYEAVFGIDGTADDTAITQHIKNIRAKLRAAGVAEPETLLKTIWGVGYQWKNEADFPAGRTAAISGADRLLLCAGAAVVVCGADVRHQQRAGAPGQSGRTGLPEGCTGRFAGHDCRHL